jgi:hypothetical protein
LWLILWLAGAASLALGVLALFVVPLYGVSMIVVSVVCPILIWRKAREIGG